MLRTTLILSALLLTSLAGATGCDDDDDDDLVVVDVSRDGGTTDADGIGGDTDVGQSDPGGDSVPGDSLTEETHDDAPDSDGADVTNGGPTSVICSPVSDRIDPVLAAAWNDSEFRALGAGRAGPNATSRCALPFTSNARYVSAASGSDSNDGGVATPWKTLQHAANNAAPGTTVYVDDSGPYDGMVVSSGGAKDKWLVFTPAVPGKPPRIVGGPGRVALVDIDASWVVVHGFDIGAHDSGSLSEDEIGINVEPNSGDISHIYLLNNHVHHIGPDDAGVDGGSCYYNAHGIIAQSEGHLISNLVIDGNELDHLYVGNSECLVVNGHVQNFEISNNYIHDVNNIAIDVIGYEKNATETARFGVINDNIVLDASNYWPYCSRGNCTYPVGDESSDGIYVDGGADLEISYNVVGRTDHGIELQSENGQLIRDVELHHNVVFNSNYKQLTVGQSANINEYSNELVQRDELNDATQQSCP